MNSQIFAENEKPTIEPQTVSRYVFEATVNTVIITLIAILAILYVNT